MSEIEEISQDDIRVKNLVRSAIASEYDKNGLKRETIFEKVCSSLRKPSVFERVFQLSNEYLEENFGYKLVALPVVSGSATVSAKTNQSRKAAVNQMNKVMNSKSVPPSAYLLVSTLSQEERSNLPNTTRDTVRLGIIQAILMIIKLSGNTIEHQHLIAALNEIQLCTCDSRELAQKDLEAFMEQLRKEKYILKTKKNIMDPESVYSWGPRAYIEFPTNNMAEFLYKVAIANNKDEVKVKFEEKVIKALNQYSYES